MAETEKPKFKPLQGKELQAASESIKKRAAFDEKLKKAGEAKRRAEIYRETPNSKGEKSTVNLK